MLTRPGLIFHFDNLQRIKLSSDLFHPTKLSEVTRGTYSRLLQKKHVVRLLSCKIFSLTRNHPRFKQSLILPIIIFALQGAMAQEIFKSQVSPPLPPGTSALKETDSTYIGKFNRNNDVRAFYGTQAISLE